MSTVHALPDGSFEVLAKGAPESILAICTSVVIDGGSVPLDDDADHGADPADRRTCHPRGFACWRSLTGSSAIRLRVQPPMSSRSLVFLGLVGLEDPIRPEVPAAIERCEVAGIRVVMITGDHPNTAASVAHAVGIPAGRVVVGSELPG